MDSSRPRSPKDRQGRAGGRSLRVLATKQPNGSFCSRNENSIPPPPQRRAALTRPVAIEDATCAWPRFKRRNSYTDRHHRRPRDRRAGSLRSERSLFDRPGNPLLPAASSSYGMRIRVRSKRRGLLAKRLLPKLWTRGREKFPGLGWTRFARRNPQRKTTSAT